jgi:uncharacterized membrane protein
MRTTLKNSALLLAAALLAAGCGSSNKTSGQTPVDPPPPPGPEATIDQVQDEAGSTVTAVFSSAVALNDANQVIGYAALSAAAPFTAALWTVDTTGAVTVTPRRLAPLDGNTFSAAFGIDGAGNAVGQSSKDAQRVAVIWKSAGAGPTELPALPSLPPGFAGNSAAFGVSADSSLIVGEVEVAPGITRAVLWNVDQLGNVAAPIVLPVTLISISSPYSSAQGVARVGTEIWVVGVVEDGAGVDHAVLWSSQNGLLFAATDLRRNELGSIAFSVNGSGQIVGEAETSNGVFVPALWAKQDDTINGEFKRTELAAAGRAVAVNGNGRVAGWTGTTDSAAIWTLPAPAPALVFNDGAVSQAYGVNASNLVVGRHGSLGFVQRFE